MINKSKLDILIYELDDNNEIEILNKNPLSCPL